MKPHKKSDQGHITHRNQSFRKDEEFKSSDAERFSNPTRDPDQSKFGGRGNIGTLEGESSGRADKFVQES